MAYKRRPNKPCVICGVLFPPKASANTCSDECAAVRRKQRSLEYSRVNAAKIAKTAKQWRSDNLEQVRTDGRARYAANAETERRKHRDRKRALRGTEPGKFAENRDPEAIKARARARWRRSQAKRRARLQDDPQ